MRNLRRRERRCRSDGVRSVTTGTSQLVHCAHRFISLCVTQALTGSRAQRETSTHLDPPLDTNGQPTAHCPCASSKAVLAAAACSARNNSGLNASGGRSASAAALVLASFERGSAARSVSSSRSGPCACCCAPSAPASIPASAPASVAPAVASAREAAAAGGGLISHAPPRSGVHAGLSAARAENDVERA